MTSYGSIPDEYSKAQTKYNDAMQLISSNRSQARKLLTEASNLLSNCNDTGAEQLAKDVKNLLNRLNS